MSIYLHYDLATTEINERLRHAKRRRRAQMVRTHHGRSSTRRRRD